jgi:ribosomal protein S18 acetylase RimI-like enzyme
VVRPGAPAPLILHGSGSSCRVRTWSGDATVAQLVLQQERRLPTPDDLRAWCADLHQRGFRRVRTGALYAQQADALLPAGFEPLQRLALLENRAPVEAAHAAGPTRRMAPAEDLAASTVDQAAFAWPWSLDAAAIAEVRTATPRHRARAVQQDGRIVAFAVSGRDGRVAFLQRLAVDPLAQRGGLGRRLVLDSLHWAARRHAGRVLVNTHVDNTAALALYASTGFVRLPEELIVLERELEPELQHHVGGDR